METNDPREERRDEDDERIVRPDEHEPQEGDDKGEPDDDVREGFADRSDDAAQSDTDTES